MIALSHDTSSAERGHYNVLSYDFLAFSAPFFWLRVLLYLDTYRFFGVCFLGSRPRPTTDRISGNAGGGQSHDERVHHLLCSAIGAIARISPSFHRTGRRGQW